MKPSNSKTDATTGQANAESPARSAIACPPTPLESIRREVRWQAPCDAYTPETVPNTRLRIALLGSERLYRGFSYECEILLVTPDNWKQVLRYGKPDMFLVESCMHTATGHWYLAQTGNPEDSAVLKPVRLANKLGIPTVYWLTAGIEYHELYARFMRHFSTVFCADSEELDLLAKEGVDAQLLEPAVQPRLFSPIMELDKAALPGFSIVSDGLADALTYPDYILKHGAEFQELGLRIYDSVDRIWKTKVRDYPSLKEMLIGSVDFESRRFLLRYAKAYLCLPDRNTTRTEQEWQALEAAASRLPVFYNGVFAENDLRADFAIQIRENKSFFAELLRHLEGYLHRERIAQATWRHVLTRHTLSLRLAVICQRIGVAYAYDENPKCTLVAPTFRANLIGRMVEQYDRQRYPNKELVIVFNGNLRDMPDLTPLCKLRDDIKVVRVPSELHAGPCMNLGIQAASGEFVFRFDDDDHYGENYVFDNMLYRKCLDYAIGGKVFRYFTYKTEKKGVRIFDRKRSSLEFRRPAVFSLDTFDFEFTPFSGATQGGKKATFVEHAFPHSVFGAADTALLDGFKSNKARLTGVIFDDLNFVVERRDNADHTWKVSEKILLTGVTDIGGNVAPVMADNHSWRWPEQRTEEAGTLSDKQLRVLFISPRVLGLLGSPGSYSLVEALSKLVSLRVICNTDQSGSKDVPQVHRVSEDIDIDYLSFRNKNSTTDILNIIKQFKPHVVHVVNYHGWVDLVPKIRKEFPGVRCVMDIKTPLLQEGSLRGQLQQKGCNASQHVDAFLAYSKENVETWLACNRAPVLVYPLGIHASGIIPRESDSEAVRHCRKFVYIGNLHEKRKLGQLVSLIRVLPPELLEQISLDIFGSGNDRERLLAQVKADGLDNVVRVHDAMPQAELFSILKNYDAGIAWVPLETYDNAPSLKFLEYMAAGLVTVGTSTFGHRRNVDAGLRAYLFSEAPASFEKVMREVIEKGVDAATIRQNAELVKRYDWENIAHRYIVPYYGVNLEGREDTPCVDMKMLKSVYVDINGDEFLLNLSAREAMHAQDVSNYEFR